MQGTDADLRIVTVEPIDEEREREHNAFSETLENQAVYCEWETCVVHLDLGMVT